MITRQFQVSRAARAAVAGILLAAGACSNIDSLLEVQNPDELDEELLQDQALVDVLVNSVTGDFDEAFDDPFIWRGSMFTDESLTGINWEQTARLSQRIVEFDEGDADLMFSEISEAVQQADSISSRLQTLLSNPGSDARMATTLIYAGYSYILLADAMCEATINVGAEIHGPLDLYGFAVDRFQDGLGVAQAAGDDDLVNLARVGLTRAHLNLGNYAQVEGIADQVPEDFRFWANYSDADPAVYNVLESRVTGGNHSLGFDPAFTAGGPALFDDPGDKTDLLTDPRVQHFASWRLGHNQLTKLYTPYQTLMMSEFNGETLADGGEPVMIGRGTDIAFASGLEAQHNKMEALAELDVAANEAEIEGFVNDRRAFGNQGPVDLSGDALIMELRDQRGRDLMLAGYRLGDLRRWLRGGDDMFPSGQHPNAQWGNYGDATCFPMPLEEYEGNPNIPVPS